MAYNQLTNLDYFDIKVALRDYLKANSDFSDYDFEGSTLGMLLDVLAYNTYYSAFNANMVVNEAFLDSATLRDNVVSLAKQLGYVPRSAVAASAAIDLTLLLSSGTSLPETVFLKRGNAFVSLVDDQVYQFVVLDDVQAKVLPNNTVYFPSLKIYEGSFVTDTYTVSSTDQFIATLNNPGIDTTSIRVRVFESSNSSVFQKFVQSDNILNVNPNSQTYFVNEVEDENYKITFGDGVFGKKLLPGQVVEISYLVTNGPATNGTSNFTYSGIVTDISGNTNFNAVVTSITVLTKSFGGANIETVDSIKINAPAMYGTQNRAVTATDYTAIIRRVYPVAADIITYGGEQADPPEYGKVKIAIKPRNLSYLSSYTKKLILDELRKYSVASIIPEIVDASIIFIEMYSRIFYDATVTTSTADAIKAKIIENINNYISSSDTEKFGGKYRYSKFISVIDSSDRSVKSNLTEIVMRKDFYPSLNNKAYYEFCFNNRFAIDLDVKTLTSTGFKVQEFPQYTVYLEDRDGKVVLYRLDSQTSEKIVLNNNQGIINYEKGEVQLYDLTIIDGSYADDKIEIRVKPEYNDVLAKREVYLDVDIDKSIFTLIQE